MHTRLLRSLFHKDDLMIYEYTDYREFLSAFYQKQKSRNPWYSFRVFATKAQLASPNYLKLVIDKKRRITDKTIESFVKGLSLATSEAAYFRALVSFNECTDRALKERFYEELVRLRRGAAQVPELHNHEREILKHWYTWAIREMVLLKDFSPDADKIVKRLINSISIKDAESSVALLERLGFIEKMVCGRYILKEPLVSTTQEISSDAIKNLHGQFMRLAFDAIFSQPLTNRVVNGVTIALPTPLIAVVREKIKAFCKEISEMFDENYQNDEVCHLLVTFFPLTKSPKT